MGHRVAYGRVVALDPASDNNHEITPFHIRQCRAVEGFARYGTEPLHEFLIRKGIVVDEFIAVLLFEQLQCFRLLVADEGIKSNRIGFFKCLHRTGKGRFIPFGFVVKIKSEPAGTAQVGIFELVFDTVQCFPVRLLGDFRLVRQRTGRRAVGTRRRRFVQFPGVGRILEVLGDQGSYRTDSDTLATEGTIQRFAVFGNDLGVVAAVEDLDGVIPDCFVTGTDTALAHDTERRIVLYQTPLFDLAFLIPRGEALVRDFELQRFVLEITFTRLVADAALKRVVDIIELHDVLALFVQGIAGRKDLDPFRRRSLTAQDESVVAFHLYNAQTTGCNRGYFRDVAHRRDIDPFTACHVQNRLALLCSDRFVINKKVYHSPLSYRAAMAM